VAAPSRRFLVAGLGNPGPKYAGNRHNVGKRCVAKLADAHRISLDRRRSKVTYGLGNIDSKAAILAHPRTYMNHSGRAVAPLVRFYQVPLHQLLIVYDDLDLPLGSVRLRPKGGSGGHKGMKSIIHQLGGRMEFPRLRVGIGRPPGRMDPAAFVLRDFTREESDLVEDAVERAVAAVGLWLRLGIDVAMNEVN